LLSVEFTKSLADPNLDLRSDGILILLYVEDLPMLYPEDTTRAGIEVKARLLEKYKITNFRLASKSTMRKTVQAPAPAP
jgi:hypothetical protein